VTNTLFARVSETLDKGLFALNKTFIECYTRQRTLGKHFIDKWFFAEYIFGHSANTLPSMKKHLAKKSTRQITNHKKYPIKHQNIFLLGEQPPTIAISLSSYHFHHF
jgi:hypothetical protein